MVVWKPIYVWNGGVRVATTNRAMNLIVHKELMREWMLKFSVTNFDSVRPYIRKGAVIECAGQKYTVVRIKQNSGMTNTTEVECYHISYVGNHHYIAAGYSFVGTLHDLLQDMITQGHGAYDLQVGECADIGTVSFSLGNTDYQSLRSGIWALSSLGIELDYDNTTVNAYTRLGSDTGKVFEFGKDLLNLERSYDFSETTQDTISYSIDVATLFKQSPEYAAEKFSLGDTVLIKDSVIGDEIRGQRIVTYDECLSDPTQDKVVIGQFKRDDVTVLADMQVQVDKSVRQGEPYNNVSISHKGGLVVDTVIGDKSVQVKVNASDGISAYVNGGKMFGISALSGRIFCQSIGNSETEYGIVGGLATGGIGMELYADDGLFAIIAELVGGGFTLLDKNQVQRAEFGTGILIRDSNGKVRIYADSGQTSLYDSNGNTIYSADSSRSHVQHGDNKLGVDANGAYKIINGIATYL